MRHFAGIIGFLILHQLLIIARKVAQFHGNCLVALVYRWSLRVSFLPIFVEVKKNISSFYWRSLRLPDWVLMPPGVAMVCHASTIKHWPDWHSSTRLSFCFAMLNVAIVQPINACQIKQVLRSKVPRMPVNWATLLVLISLILISIPVIPSGLFSRRPGFRR